MHYEIMSEKEKQEILKVNNKDIIKSSVEFAIAVAVTYVSGRFMESLPPQTIVQKIVEIIGFIGVTGLDFHAGMTFIDKLLERDKIHNGYTVLYDKEDTKKIRR